jgi:hypothetical protein
MQYDSERKIGVRVVDAIMWAAVKATDGRQAPRLDTTKRDEEGLRKNSEHIQIEEKEQE